MYTVRQPAARFLCPPLLLPQSLGQGGDRQWSLLWPKEHLGKRKQEVLLRRRFQLPGLWEPTEGPEPTRLVAHASDTACPPSGPTVKCQQQLTDTPIAC